MSERVLNFNDFDALAAEILKAGNTLRFEANGNSMRPFIYNGQIVEIEPVEPGKLKRGDIVLCRLEKDWLVLHRIVRMQAVAGKKKLVIQGDAMPLPDGAIAPEQVLGRVAAVYRGEDRLGVDRHFISFLAVIWMEFAPVRPFLIDLWHFLRGNRKRG
jgi:signal peptidase